MLSLGVSRESARTGANGTNGAVLGNDDSSSTTPTIFWGKGFGDLPIGVARSRSPGHWATRLPTRR